MSPNNNKYHNHEVDVDGQHFDSKLEYNRYLYLLSLARKGEIRNLRCQVKFDLTPKYMRITRRRYSKRGIELKPKINVAENPSTYTADFVYEEKYATPELGEVHRLVVEDTKGFSSETFRLKKKLMLHMHHIFVHLIHKATEPIPPYYEIYEEPNKESTDIVSTSK